MPAIRYAAVRGRFAPPTRAAVATLQATLLTCDRLIVLVSAAWDAPSSRLPWTVRQRESLLRSALGADAARVAFRYAGDHPYDVAGQEAEIARHIHGVLDMGGQAGATVERLPDIADDPQLTADLMGGGDGWRAAVPDAVAADIDAFRASDVFAGLAAEHAYVESYRASWAKAPYPPILATVDAAIVHIPPGGEAHLLLVQRGGIPGKGQWALPGGFVEPDEWLTAAAFRELREETGLTLSDAEAQTCLRGSAVFDDPQRSSRGRIITHAFHFVVEGRDLPAVEGQDDAVAARWVPLRDLAAMRGTFFEDHWHIITRFIAPGSMA